MEMSNNVREYAAELSIAEDENLMEEKSKEFVQNSANVYAKA